MGWLRQAARHRFRRFDEARISRNLPPETLSLIDEFRTALVRHLTAAIGSESADEEMECRIAAAAVCDNHLIRFQPSRLATMARAFALEYAAEREALEAARRLANGTLFWPMIPRDFLTADGRRRVTALATRDDLRQEGILQDLCLSGGGELAHMARSCAAGCVYLLSIRDAQSGTPLSTAEVRTRVADRGERIGLSIQQHRAKSNARPSSACVAALREVLQWADGQEVQDHLATGRRMAWKRSRLTAATEQELGLNAAAKALRVALGERRYDKAIAEAKAAAPSRSGESARAQSRSSIRCPVRRRRASSR
jgi:hypothetical protein